MSRFLAVDKTRPSSQTVTMMDAFPRCSLEFLALVGALSVGSFALKTVFVLLQTFVLKGKSVRVGEENFR